MKVLVLNAGSSSLKYQLLDMEKEEWIIQQKITMTVVGQMVIRMDSGPPTILRKMLPTKEIL